MIEQLNTLTTEHRNSLLALSTSLLTDARASLQLSENHLDCSIKPVVPFSRMCGTAVTIRLEVARDKTESNMELLDQVFKPNRDINSPLIVIQVPKELHNYGIFGESMATHGSARGFVGALVEGSVRDTHELHDMNFPVFSRTVTPGFIIGKASTVEINKPVVIGGMTVHAGDVILGDNDGVVVIRPHELNDLLAIAQAIKDWEDQIRSMLAKGTSIEVARKLAGPMP